MTEPRIVPMTKAHIDAIMRYEVAMFGTEAWSRSAYRDELADTRNRYYVAVENEDGRLLGWGGILVTGTSVDLLTVGVVPSDRRRGLAKTMLAAFYAESVRRGATEMLLEVRVDNVEARKLYAAEGFAEIGLRKGYYDMGRADAVTMRRDL